MASQMTVAPGRSTSTNASATCFPLRQSSLVFLAITVIVGLLNISAAPSSAAAKVKGKKPAVGRKVLRPASSLSWTACGAVECADLSVPIDAANPDLGSTRIKIARSLATSSQPRIGVLFLNPGGPGGSATELVNAFAQRDMRGANFGNLDRFDLVGFDPRGVGLSQRVVCGSKLSDIGLNPFTTTRTVEQRADITKRWAQSCADKTGPLFSHTGSIDAADDMDRVRTALGEETISYLGFSYGSILGSVYASKYGSRLRANILDAAVDPTKYGTSYLTEKALGVEQRVRDFAAACFGQRSCALSNGATGPEEIVSRIAAAISKVETSSEDGATRVALVRNYFASLLEEQVRWKDAATLISRLDDPTVQQLLEGIPPINPIAELSDDPAFWAVECHDGAFPTNETQLAETRAAIAAQAPITGPVFSSRDDVCVNWPGGLQPLSVVSTAQVTTLVIGGTRDSRTPFVWSSGLTTAMGNAVLLTRDGDGHTSFDRSLCVRQAIGKYLTNLTLPAAGTVCSSRK
jgi:pimeloyl-ACP methyl ester carboxylesterase